jgi:hypothetical protein
VAALAGAAAAAALLAPLAANAQSFRCVGKDGKKYYGSAIPNPCIGQPIEQLNAQGTVIRRIDPVGDEKLRQAQEVELEKKKQEELVLREQRRRNQALLATYTSEKDIEEARARAIAENDKEVKEVELRIGAIRKRQAGYEKELEFYKGKNKPPAKLNEDMKNAEIDLKAQENLLSVKKKDSDGINARYDEDKRRYQELTGKNDRKAGTGKS